MRATYQLLTTVGVAVGAAAGVIVSSQFLLSEGVETAVGNGIVAGIVAAIVFAATGYTRRTFL